MQRGLLAAGLLLTMLAFQNCADPDSDPSNPDELAKNGPLVAVGGDGSSPWVHPETEPSGTVTASGNSNTCAAFSSDSDIHLVSIYESRSDSSFNHHPVGTAQVSIGAGDKPILLIVSSYEPTDWKLSGATDRIACVIYNGYHKQTVAGVDSPRITGRSFVADNLYFLPSADNWMPQTQAEVAAVVDSITRRYGRAPKSTQFKYTGTSFTVQ